ncbi:hypothetical protein GCM10007049_00860 [Echinicola pacifica]|uniref:Uncharacterized protein n=1 Tax=Echinicola pacifica TaxID=346377 RepID=A0A918PKM7_9BACT|nr:hypothetical protein [Echinicola pacifica]GGZ12948.1 hypothetical protein GCM10007049_00860 [Echinicola pacifica]
MKIIAIYTIVALLIVGGIFSLLSSHHSPDERLVGRWREISWQYEKLDSPSTASDASIFAISEHIKREISRDLVIHQAETWEILPHGQMQLHLQGGEIKALDWRLKGRGHILKLMGKNRPLEHYQIQKLNGDSLEVHFNSDLQTRGIIKMTFVKEHS